MWQPQSSQYVISVALSIALDRFCHRMFFSVIIGSVTKCVIVCCLLVTFVIARRQLLCLVLSFARVAACCLLLGRATGHLLSFVAMSAISYHVCHQPCSSLSYRMGSAQQSSYPNPVGLSGISLGHTVAKYRSSRFALCQACQCQHIKVCFTLPFAVIKPAQQPPSQVVDETKQLATWHCFWRLFPV